MPTLASASSRDPVMWGGGGGGGGTGGGVDGIAGGAGLDILRGLIPSPADKSNGLSLTTLDVSLAPGGSGGLIGLTFPTSSSD